MMVLAEVARWGWLIAIAINGVIGLVLWGMRATYVSRQELAEQLERRDAARSRDHADVYTRIAQLEQQGSRVEAQLAAVPSIQAVHGMEVRLEQIAGDLKAMSTGLVAMRGDVADFKQSVTRIQDYLLNSGRSNS